MGTGKKARLGSHLPRLCGIATFTSDLSDAIQGQFPEMELFVLAMNDGDKRYGYPGRVRFELAESDMASYRRGGYQHRAGHRVHQTNFILAG